VVQKALTITTASSVLQLFKVSCQREISIQLFNRFYVSVFCFASHLTHVKLLIWLNQYHMWLQFQLQSMRRVLASQTSSEECDHLWNPKLSSDAFTKPHNCRKAVTSPRYTWAHRCCVCWSTACSSSGLGTCRSLFSF